MMKARVMERDKFPVQQQMKTAGTSLPYRRIHNGTQISPDRRRVNWTDQ
jgi:hypothetical protein